MTKLFHNTTNSDNSEIHEGIKRNYKQNEIVLKFLKLQHSQSFDAWDIQYNLSEQGTEILITSVRRALNSLERSGMIKKVGTAKGKMKMSTTLYQFVSDTPLLCKSLPKQIKRTPEHGC